MREAPQLRKKPSKPALLNKTVELSRILKKLEVSDIKQIMHVSKPLAEKTYTMLQRWNTEDAQQTSAIDAFVGDIYSGLQANTWTDRNHEFANQNLRILSGLYGILRPSDDIMPYRLEMGYKLPLSGHRNLYEFWGKDIADTIPLDSPLLNLSAVEYSRVVTPNVETKKIITPEFLTIHPVTGQPTFVVVHTKIARGAFARWVIQQEIEDTQELPKFSEIGYRYSSELSTPAAPVFVANKFQGLGLSVRLQK